MRIGRKPYRALLMFSLFVASCIAAIAAPNSGRVALPRVAARPLQAAVPVGRLAVTARVDMAITLPLRNQDQLTDFLRRVTDPSDPDYGHYLTPEQFKDRYAPTEANYEAVQAYARSEGLSVTGYHDNRLLLDVSGTRDTVESAFAVRLYQYRGTDGRVFHAPDSAPSIPAGLAGVISGVIGLSDAAVRHSYLVPRNAVPRSDHQTTGIGTGPGEGLSPSDIKAAYNLAGVSLNGSGQTLAVFELDGFNPSDIASYESEFGIPNVPLQTVLVDGANGVPGSGASEVTLDIELQISLAYDAAKIIVYESANSDSGIIDGYSQIAEDDEAKEVSTCWGVDEQDSDASVLHGEYAIFQQMAAQGQTVFAAAGDYGAYDGGSEGQGLRVDDPGSQPYVCSAGGTTLSTQYNGGPWRSETTWNSGSVANGAGGGGISSIWPIPSWQQSAITSASKASSTMRNVPDISLDSDPDTGYAIYYQGGWSVYGGTSCSAPLWAAFTALLNQERTHAGQPVVGQASPALYPLLSSGGYRQDFHDIADGSNNLYYPTVTGFDDATGLGTLNGTNLLSALALGSQSGLPSAPTGLRANAGNGQVVLTWQASTNATGYNIYRSQISGSGYVNVGTTSDLTFADTGVTNGNTYYYVVAAVNNAGDSGYSNQVTAMPAVPVVIAAPPTELTTFSGNAQVTLTWQASSGAASYNVYRSTSNGSGYGKVGSTGQLNYTDYTVVNGATYYYVVTAVDTAGESGYSNVKAGSPSAGAPIIASYPAGVNFFSLPYDYSGVPPANILGYSDPVLAVWNPSALYYALSPNAPANQIRLGAGYWARFPQAVSVTLQGTPASTLSDFPISLASGWNQIGDPFPASIALSGVDVLSSGNEYSYGAAVSNGLIGSVMYEYDTATNAYVSVPATGSLKPGLGYFILANGTVTLEVPAT